MLSRRNFNWAFCGSMILLSGTAFGASFRTVPQRASARIIVDNYFAGDPDALVALAHQLLTPKTRTVLCTSSALNPKMSGSVPADRSAAVGRDIAVELIERAKIVSPPRVEVGSRKI